MNLFVYLFGFLATFSAVAAEKDAIDPSDIGKPLSYLSAGLTQYSTSYDDQGNAQSGGTGINVTGAYSQNYSVGNRFLVLGEVKTQPDFNLDYGRARYFQILDSGLTAFPKFGFSLDYIGTLESNSISAGALAQINLGVPFMRLFWNVSYSYAHSEVPQAQGRESFNGFYTNIYFNTLLNENFAYLAIIPEYQYTTNDNADNNAWRISAMLGFPITDTNRLWMSASYVYQQGIMEYSVNDTPYRVDGKNTYIMVALSYYFSSMLVKD